MLNLQFLSEAEYIVSDLPVCLITEGLSYSLKTEKVKFKSSFHLYALAFI